MTARDIVMSAAGNSGDSKTYIEDVFSTYLYTGNGSTQTINNGIDLAGKGGMVITKSRNTSSRPMWWVDSVLNQGLRSDTAAGAQSVSSFLTNFTGSGYTLNGTNDAAYGPYGFDINGETYASWTFRKAPKFFDVVTYTGNGVAGRTISHSLGQAPGMIIVKRTSSDSFWRVYHRSLGATKVINLEQTAAAETSSTFWNDTEPTSTVFTVGNQGNVNGNGDQFVAYLFAHDTTTDGLIQCGSYTGNGSTTGPVVNLGWEPQYVLIKKSSDGITGSWSVHDSMRGMAHTSFAWLIPNQSVAETALSNGSQGIVPTSTGFMANRDTGLINELNATYIYMAIRRGPMKAPTDGTKVFQPVAHTGTSATKTLSTGFSTDFVFTKQRSDSLGYWDFEDRLRGSGAYLSSNVTSAEATSPNTINFQTSDGFILGNDSWVNNSSFTYIANAFRRAPGFFDVVCYTGKGTNYLFEHNLKAVPELVFIKRRNSTSAWIVYSANVGNDKYLTLNSTAAAASSSTMWDLTTPIETHFQIGTNTSVNTSGGTYVWYGFASCPGVSKVGSYTGNGSTQNIDCGFTNGARFVMIKRTSESGDWYVWDTARGIVAGNDPHLSLNTTAAEVTTDDTVDPASTGFVVNQVAATNVNVSGGSYIYLAIA